MISLSSVSIRLRTEPPLVTHNYDLSCDEEADSDGGEEDDPGGELRDKDSTENCVQYKAAHLHHDHSEATEEP